MCWYLNITLENDTEILGRCAVKDTASLTNEEQSVGALQNIARNVDDALRISFFGGWWGVVVSVIVQYISQVL